MYRSKGSLLALSVFYKVFGIMGVLWTLFFSYFVWFCLFVEPTTDRFIIGFGVVCVIVGIIWIMVSIVEDKLLRDYKDYKEILLKDEEHSVLSLVKALGIPEEKVQKNLTKMIRRKHLVGVKLDQEKRHIIPVNAKGAGTAMPVFQKKPVMVDVTCEHCGAPNTVCLGETARCEYCDSVIGGRYI